MAMGKRYSTAGGGCATHKQPGAAVPHTNSRGRLCHTQTADRGCAPQLRSGLLCLFSHSRKRLGCAHQRTSEEMKPLFDVAGFRAPVRPECLIGMGNRDLLGNYPAMDAADGGAQ